ncbi:MAG: hypothetical protein JXR80_05240 [Deltaproteobacteria bacterium]|nr:hypothetical protein [Deltaproteobacteria bacterium]
MSSLSLQKIICCLIFSVLLWIAVSISSEVWAKPFAANANWRYDHADNDGETSWSFDQNYNLSLMKELSSGLDFSSSIRYSQDSSSADDDGSRINPSLSLNLRNDLFSSVLGATFSRLEKQDEPTNDSWSWNASWLSQWDEVWPALRFNFSESYRQDDATPRQIDSQSRQFNSGISYSWRFLESSYDFNYAAAKDNIRTTATDSERHSANLKLEESWDFWGQLVTFSVGERVSYNLTQDSSKVGAGNDYFIRDYNVKGFYALDSTPEEGELDANPALTDGNLYTSAGIDIASSLNAHNIGFRPDSFPVNRVRLYFTTELTPAQQQQLAWDLYESDDGKEWRKNFIAPFIRYEYDPLNFITVAVVDLPVFIGRRDYAKLVVSSLSTLFETISISELEAGEQRTAESDTVTTESTFINSESRASLIVRPLDGWTVSSNVLYRYASNDPGTVNHEVNASLSSDYYWNRYFSFTLGVNENRDWSDDVEDVEESNRSYSLILRSFPLDTLDATLSFMRSEQYEDGELIETSDSINAYLTARLYPDVTASFTAGWSSSDDGSDFTWRCDSTIRLTQRMNLELYCDNQTVYGGSFNFRPSDVLALSSSFERDDDSDRNTFSTSVSWITSETIRTSLAYFWDDSPEGSDHGIQGSVSWELSSLFTLRSDISYLLSRGSDENSDSLFWSLQLNMRW